MRTTRVTTDTPTLFPNQRAVAPERLYVAEQNGKAYILRPSLIEDEDAGVSELRAWDVQEFDAEPERDAYLRGELTGAVPDAPPADAQDTLGPGSDEDDETIPADLG
ncbi:MAG TPA: hypothetical protein VHN99_02890 [Deinococcales bacterium]|nr:hypothetical protein [Deinococcales bacterium]